MGRVVHGLARGCDPPRATAAPGFFLPFRDGRIVGRDHGRDDDVLRGDHLRAGVEAVGEPRLRGRAGRVRLLPDAACHGRGRVVGVNIDGRRWRLYRRGAAALPGVKFDAMRGSKRKTAFPGFISRFIFVTDLYLQTVCKKPRIGANLGLPGCQLPTASRCVNTRFPHSPRDARWPPSRLVSITTERSPSATRPRY